MFSSTAFARAKQVGMWVGSIVVIGVILWIDITTGIWSELVILSGLAAGLVTFLLTVLVLDKIIARQTARKWAPVNRLALTEFLHALADEDQSEISRGHIVPRALTPIRAAEFTTRGTSDIGSGERGTAESRESGRDTMLHELRDQVVRERVLLADALSRWAEFLAASGNNERVLLHVADISLLLDKVRDAALESEQSLASAAATADNELNFQIEKYNNAMLSLERELRAQLI